MLLHTDGQDFVPLAFVPITDLDKVFSALEDSLGSPKDAGNGVMEIPGPQPMFIKEQGKFAFIGQTIESMARLPNNPVAELGNLPKDYDIAIQGNVQNIPEEYIGLAMDGLEEGIRSGLEQLPDEDKAQQQEMLEAQLEQMKTYITESDQIVIGWKTEPAEKRTFIDMSFTALPD